MAKSTGESSTVIFLFYFNRSDILLLVLSVLGSYSKKQNKNKNKKNNTVLVRRNSE